MAGLSAGEVFVSLVVKGDGVAPALKKASSAVKEFGKGISAASVATGMIIADIAKSAFGAMASLGKGALDRAIVNPKTAKGLQDLQRSLYFITENMKKWGVTIISLVLPYLNMLASTMLSVVTGITGFIEWMEKSAVVAGIQSGNIFKAFDLLFTQIAAMVLEAVAPMIAPFVGFAAMVIEVVKGIASGVGVVFKYIGDVFKTYWEGMKAGFKKLGEMFTTFASGVMVGWQFLAKQMLTMFTDVIRKTGQLLKGLVIGLRAIAPEIASQLGPIESVADMLGGITIPAFEMGMGNLGNLFEGIQTGFAELWNQAGAMGNDIMQQQLDKMREKISTLSDELNQKRDEAGQAAESSMGFITAQKGISGTSALLAGAGSNIMFQTQKDILREAKEQKILAQKQLEEQRKIAKQRGAVFVQ